ncbi:nuclear transport factor 2 family protein [Bradyrhizobium ottawaense]|uniref:nuclear transport factor 2 family protein n=1 Tax=Bradyrhizobium ottawaense TaxID=931866 RepID=UPI001FEAD108|nr:nuclear transport factor 2 family protein [Bradyrhizobium ottawaense]
MNDEARLKTWNAYQAAWGPVGESERRRLLEQSVAADCVYTDPGSQVAGREALMARIGQTQLKFPGACFRNDSFLEHHEQALFRWTMYRRHRPRLRQGREFWALWCRWPPGSGDRLLRAAGCHVLMAGRRAQTPRASRALKSARARCASARATSEASPMPK